MQLSKSILFVLLSVTVAAAPIPQNSINSYGMSQANDHQDRSYRGAEPQSQPRGAKVSYMGLATEIIEFFNAIRS